jgi:hypothetical protein
VSRSGISRSNLAWPDALELFYIARSADVAAAGLRDPAALRGRVAVRQGGRRQRPSRRQFGVDGRGKARLNFCRAKDAKAAKSRSDAMAIAQPFMAGYRVKQM